jgi:hypothetical protein
MEKNKTMELDIALLYQHVSPVQVSCKNIHTIDLDPMDISSHDFKTIFYPEENNGYFGLNSNISPSLHPFISFQEKTYKGNSFSLMEEVLACIEKDLNVTRKCLSTHSMISLTQDLSGINSFLDIFDTGNLLSSLTWKHIVDVLNRSPSVVLIISVLLRSPNTHILPIVFKFKYKIKDFLI